jgi:hypothetical protein
MWASVGRGALAKWKCGGNWDTLALVADLAQLDLRAKGGEARIRALLEDLTGYYKGVYPGHQLALAVWFGKTPDSDVQNLLALFTGLPMKSIVVSPRQTLHWKIGVDEPPFVNIHATSVEYFSGQLSSNRDAVAHFLDRREVLYFDKNWLTSEIVREFKIVTEPPGLIKGWYLGADQYDGSQTVRSLLASGGHGRPEMGIVKTWESPDFGTCRALVHVEVSQRWLPSSAEGITPYSYYSDWQEGRPGYFLLEGGALYQILKFEVKNAPNYSAVVLEKSRDDRYPEVYLRAVYPPQQSAA